MHGPKSSDPPTTILYFLPPPPPLPAFSLPPFPPTEVERRGGHIPPPFCARGIGLDNCSSDLVEEGGDKAADTAALHPLFPPLLCILGWSLVLLVMRLTY